MRPPAVLTLTAALVLGAATAWWSIPRWQAAADLRGIVDEDAQRRADAWQSLMAARRGRPPRAVTLLDSINARLAEGSDACLLDAAAMLGSLHRWGWGSQPSALVVRELRARARTGDDTHMADAAACMRECPLDLGGEEVRGVIDLLLESADADVRREAFGAACGWAGPKRGEWLASLPAPAGDDTLERRRLLALSCCSPAPAASQPTADDVEALAALPLDVLEARLVLDVHRAPDEATPVLAILNIALDPPPALAYILRMSGDKRVHDTLERMAADGDLAARSALQARSPGLDDAQSRLVAADRSSEPWRRRMAAWRWPRVPEPLVLEILADDPAEPEGSVFAAAMLAEQRLSRGAAVSLAEAWIRDFNDDRKRAGALLAALLGVHHELLRQAYDLEDVGTVRTTQRLALHALGHPVAGDDPIEFAYRALRHDADGDFKPDAVLCLLLCGHVPAVRLLATPPQDNWRLAVQQRSWLIERFVPQWAEATGRPIGGDLRALRLHFDLLEALCDLTLRVLEFDEETRRFGYE